MASSFYFAIVGTNDHPLYETEITPSSRPSSAVDSLKRDEHRHLNQFIVHSALDIVEEVQWNTQNLYLKVVDKFNEYLISVYLSVGNVKFMLLHDSKSEDSIKGFFVDVHELYLKTLMNPFYTPNTAITSAQFDQRVKLAAKRFL
ncbi:hypothetical protein BZG36_01420 [Bifiguratus adelaidae]|uniref:Trafficking protein particle complex subunit 2 n=1 Tax=Bifiguratus adelaidae TaxID=1938954 RepID=A0A261Y541_9FUNG|nr:hypothetical protein BZG36_01420 [Bifiguratus adelaidae]